MCNVLFNPGLELIISQGEAFFVANSRNLASEEAEIDASLCQLVHALSIKRNTVMTMRMR